MFFVQVQPKQPFLFDLKNDEVKCVQEEFAVRFRFTRQLHATS